LFHSQASDALSNTSEVFEILECTPLGPPVVLIRVTPEQIEVGDEVSIDVSVSSPINITSTTAFVDNEIIDLDQNGNASYTATSGGLKHIKVAAVDEQGQVTNETAEIIVIDPSDQSSPTISLNLGDEQVITSQYEIAGSIDDQNFVSYTLESREHPNGIWSLISEDEVTEYSGVLGVFDPTNKRNGFYEIRFIAEDILGHVSTLSEMVSVEGNVKIGQFTLSFEDMSIALPGFDLSLLRSYDSRIKSMGDFGVGWELGYKSVRLGENRNAGDGWEIQDIGGFLPNFVAVPTKSHIVAIAIPGGRTQKFDVKAEFYNQFSPDYGVLTFEPRLGTYSTLECLDAGEFVLLGDELYDINGDFSEPSNPSLYKLTLMDGTYYIIDQNADGIIEMGDNNSNRLSFADDSIWHSTGVGISITRDAFGRITSIADQDSRTVTYSYDEDGNLDTVTDARNNITTYNYLDNHYLNEIIDPRGISATRTEYDAEGRMVRQINPAGDELVMTHDLDNNTEIVSDFNGNETTYQYDDNGNVISKTDIEGNTWNYTYNTHDNLIRTINPDGSETSSTFDNKGNELTSTNERGYVTKRTYNNLGQVKTEEDPIGRVTTYNYDAYGNLEQTIGPDGVITERRTYTPRGNVKTETDALGNVTTYGYDAAGRMVSRTDPLGRTTEYGLDNRGNTIYEVNPDGDTTFYYYDNNDNQVMTISVNGDTTSSTYNVFNKIASQTDALGNVTTFEYDLFGQLSKTIAPDNTFTQKTYDGQGNVKTSIDEANRVTRFEYDHENRVVKTVLNDSSYTQVEYDAMGRRTATIDAKGNVTQYDYDEVGNNTLVWDALGNETTYEYDAVNRRTAMVDALNQRTEYTYDDYDRLVRTTFADGTYKETEYDLAGRKTAEIDQEGKRTEFAYDAVGNLTSVTDAMDFVTSYTYDDNNNRITQTDANNHTTTMDYDKLNRLIKRTYPNGDEERFGYDDNGNMTYKVSGIDSTAFEYDNRNREILRFYGNSDRTVETRYTIDSKRDSVIDYRGVTTYEWGDCCGQLVRVDNPDGTFMEYEYDANKNITARITPWGTTEYTYDTLNRMDSVIAPDNSVTEYFYNAVGNRDSVSNGNGTSTRYLYDNLNRLTDVINYGPGGVIISSYGYELNDAGIRTAVVEEDGSRVDYVYDDLYRLTSETRTGTNSYTTSYTYDNVGNRLTKDNGVVTNYTYNIRDQLQSEDSAGVITSYTYDASGRTATKTDASGVTTYIWKDNDRLDSLVTPSGIISYEYDADNNRVQTNDGVSVKNYLVDTKQRYAQIIAEYDDQSSLTAEYVFGLERISQERAGVKSTYLADGQGSIRELTDATGSVTDSYEFYAFGELLASTGTTENEFLYVGEQWDPNAQFYYNRARYLDPTLGRFISVDPFSGYSVTPISLHRYLYAGVDPINKHDPSGEVFGYITQSLKQHIQTIGRRIELVRSRIIIHWHLKACRAAANKMVRNAVKMIYQRNGPQALRYIQGIVQTHSKTASGRLVLQMMREFAAKSLEKMAFTHNPVMRSILIMILQELSH